MIKQFFQEIILLLIYLILFHIIQFFNFMVNAYKNNLEPINMIKDMFVVGSVYEIIKYLFNKNRIEKENQLKSDLKFNKNIQTNLFEYVLLENKNEIKDICIRFIFIENYPWQIENISNDGFKHYLYVKTYENRIKFKTWIDHTGVWFKHHLWFSENSIYINSNDEYFITKKSQNYPNFQEYSNKIILLHLPFKNIIEVDFDNKIEYEPIFYIKYAYDDYKNLYDDQIIVINKNEDELLNLKLNRNNEIKPPLSK